MWARRGPRAPGSALASLLAGGGGPTGVVAERRGRAPRRKPRPAEPAGVRRTFPEEGLCASGGTPSRARGAKTPPSAACGAGASPSSAWSSFFGSPSCAPSSDGPSSGAPSSAAPSCVPSSSGGPSSGERSSGGPSCGAPSSDGPSSGRPSSDPPSSCGRSSSDASSFDAPSSDGEPSSSSELLSFELPYLGHPPSVVSSAAVVPIRLPVGPRAAMRLRPFIRGRVVLALSETLISDLKAICLCSRRNPRH